MRKALLAAGLGLVSAVLALALGRVPFARTIELKTYDWRMRETADPARARTDIVIVEIDEASIRALAPYFGRWPWPRVVHAHLLNFLARAKPRAVVYDVLFGEPDRSTFKIGDDQWTGEQSDAELASAAKRLGTVIFPGDASEEAAGRSAGVAIPRLPGPPLPVDAAIETRPVFSAPMPALVASARSVAEDLMVLDADGVVRRYVPAIRVGDTMVPSLAVAGAIASLKLKEGDLRWDAAGVHLGDRLVPLETSTLPTLDGSVRSARRMHIAFAGVWPDQRRTYPTYSFAPLFQSQDLLLAGEKPPVDPAVFGDRIVIVGATAAGLYDQKAVPFAQKMSGSEIHAQVLDSILSNRFLTPAPMAASVAVTVVCALVVALATVLVGPWVGVAAAVVVSGALVFGLTGAFHHHGLWFPMVEPMSGVWLAAFAGVIYQYAIEGREKRRVKRLFSRYVSRDVFQQLVDSPEEARLGGKRRMMTVLFCDIRGFTAVSERGDPESIVSQLNQYFSAMVPVVFAHKGTVDKFVGDMIMALYGAPLEDPDHADHAVQTSLAMCAELARLNQRWAAERMPPLDIGIGINTGEMVAGNLGSETIMSYTVIGDNVNLGSRLESLTRQFQTRIIVSEATRQALKQEYDLRPLGDVTVKGKSVPVRVFDLRLPSTVGEVLDTYSPLAPAADKGKAASQPPVQKES